MFEKVWQPQAFVPDAEKTKYVVSRDLRCPVLQAAQGMPAAEGSPDEPFPADPALVALPERA
jgi:hypothetical protein